MTVEEKINEVVAEYTRLFGKDDCFKTWVENINNGEKYIVWCSCRYTWGHKRKTQRLRTTIYGQKFLKSFSKPLDKSPKVCYNKNVNKRAGLYKRRKELNMKNVNGLAKAILIVESACENGEITIIGHGNLPTAKELLGKCILYINEMYGVDVLAEVVKDLLATKESESESICISCNGCSGCAEDGIANEDDTPTIEIDVDKVARLVKEVLDEEMGFLSDNSIGNIVLDFKEYYESLVGEVADEYDTNLVADAYREILSDNLDIGDYDEDYIDDVIRIIIRSTDEYIFFV